MPAVPTQTFPQITSSTAAWIASGYTLVDLSTSTGATLCAKARDWIMNRWSTSGITNALIRINTTCTFTNNNNDTFSILGNLAILNDGGIQFLAAVELERHGRHDQAHPLHQCVLGDVQRDDQGHLRRQQYELQCLD